MQTTPAIDRLIGTLEWTHVADAAETLLDTMVQEAVEVRVDADRDLTIGFDEQYARALIAEIPDGQADAFHAALAAVSRRVGEEDDNNDILDEYGA